MIRIVARGSYLSESLQHVLFMTFNNIFNKQKPEAPSEAAGRLCRMAAYSVLLLTHSLVALRVVESTHTTGTVRLNLGFLPANGKEDEKENH